MKRVNDFMTNVFAGTLVLMALAFVAMTVVLILDVAGVFGGCGR